MLNRFPAKPRSPNMMIKTDRRIENWNIFPWKRFLWLQFYSYTNIFIVFIFNCWLKERRIITTILITADQIQVYVLKKILIISLFPIFCSNISPPFLVWRAMTGLIEWQQTIRVNVSKPFVFLHKWLIELFLFFKNKVHYEKKGFV